MKNNQPKNAYKGGAEVFKGYVRLSSNENNYGPAKSVKSIIKQNIKFSNIYPELDGESLRNQIAKSYKINSKQIILGAGSDEVLQMIYAAFSRPNDEVIFTKYAFAMYSIYAKNFKCKVKTFDDKDFQFKLESLNKIISKKTKIIFLANPNNPTGSIFYKNELIKFLNKIKKTTLVVLDAAYCEYIKDHKYDDGMKLVKNYSNLIITRSFSKIFALGGLRIGWGYANSKIISQLYQYKKPFNVSRLSCIAAQESLKNKKWINESIKNNSVNKTLTCKQLNNKSFEIIDTKANFILLKFKNSIITQQFVDFLHLNKITVRSLSSYGLNNFVRMTIGTKTDMKKAILVANKFNV